MTVKFFLLAPQITDAFPAMQGKGVIKTCVEKGWGHEMSTLLDKSYVVKGIFKA